MEQILRELQKALDAGLYYLAVILALDLPDICGALESGDGTASGSRYRAWFEAWMAPRYPMMTAADLYSLRCGVLHQGRMGHPKMQYGRVLFTLPDARNITVHQCVLNDALVISARHFCVDMGRCVDEWFAAKKNDPNVVTNLPRLLRYRENGLAPYIEGLPLIA